MNYTVRNLLVAAVLMLVGILAVTSFLRAERRSEAAADWRLIEEAVRSGDGDRAEAAARRRFAHSAAAVRAELEGGGPTRS
jgi:DNA-binding GntR family transcriptional regulator